MDTRTLYTCETHAHTAETSKCSRLSGAELARFYYRRGFHGLCVTDHFLNGNTLVPPDRPWADRIELCCLGFEQARQEGRRLGLDVFFGWEYSHHGTDLLTYGLDRSWLLDHPDLLDLDLRAYCNIVHESGGFIVHAHPFREAEYIAMIRLLPRHVDAVEVANAGRTAFENRLANEYAENYGLPRWAGSDTHEVRDGLCGLRFPERPTNPRELLNAVRGGQATCFRTPDVPAPFVASLDPIPRWP